MIPKDKIQTKIIGWLKLSETVIETEIICKNVLDIIENILQEKDEYKIVVSCSIVSTNEGNSMSQSISSKWDPETDSIICVEFDTPSHKILIQVICLMI